MVMKNSIIILIGCLIIFSAPLRSQVTIGADKEPEVFSVLELGGKRGGLRLNQLDIPSKEELTDKINSKESHKIYANGLILYDEESGRLQMWKDGKWLEAIMVENGTDAKGKSGQVLMSNGEEALPAWSTIATQPVKTGEYYMYSSSALKDETGVILANNSGSNIYNLNDPLDNSWIEIPGLATTVAVPQSEGQATASGNRLVMQFQTSAQTGGPVVTGGWISFAVGIFINETGESGPYRLKLVRTYLLSANALNNFDTYTLIGAIDNLEPGEHQVKVAVKRRNGNMNRNLAVGRPDPSIADPGNPNLNNFMAQSALRADLYVTSE